jgi:hypothetical protein
MGEGGGWRRLKAIFRSAVAWGVTWGALGSVWATLMRIGDNIPFPMAILDGIGMGIRIGFGGGLAGAAFATFISLAYRGRKLGEISTVKFGVGAAIFAGAFIPVWMQTMSLISGGGLVPFNLIDTDIIYSALFGGITAAGTMALAKRDAAQNPELSSGNDPDLLNRGAGGWTESAARDQASARR